MKSLNNKLLIGVLLGLVAVFVATRMLRNTSRTTNMKQELVSVDTSKVDQIKIYPQSQKGEELKLVKQGKVWQISSGTKSGVVAAGEANAAMNYFIKLRPLQLISRKKEKWNEYQVGDSSTHVQLLAGEKVLADVRIGRVGFNQVPGGQFGAGGIFTYVRLEGEDEVYSVEGFLESTFNRSLNDWRDKSFARLKDATISKITFRYPADSSFVLEKRDQKWFAGSTAADSTAVANYIRQFEFKNATTFVEDFSPTTASDAAVVFSNESGTVLTIEAWRRADDWAVMSSLQNKIYFSSKGLEGVLEKKSYFLKAEKK